MTGAPKVSVVVPVHNRETYVRDAIASILAQSFGDYELLVIDDGSTDGSRAAAQAFDDARIRLVGNDANEGIPKTRNIAVGLARGEYLAFLDSDDIALPNRLARQVAYLDGHPDHAAVGAWIAWMDDGGRPLGRIKRLATTAEDIAAQRLFRPGIVNSAAMARTAVLRGFPHREDFRVGSDFEMWARFAGAHRIANLPEVLVRCRVHGDRTTVALAEQVKSVRFAIYRPQLAALGVAFADSDLERHFLLRRMQNVGFTPDAEYLRWAESWLLGLRGANATACRYPEPAFSEALGVFWAKACRHAFGLAGLSGWRRFLSSPLSRAAWPGLWRLARLHGPAPLRPAPIAR